MNVKILIVVLVIVLIGLFFVKGLFGEDSLSEIVFSGTGDGDSGLLGGLLGGNGSGNGAMENGGGIWNNLGLGGNGDTFQCPSGSEVDQIISEYETKRTEFLALVEEEGWSGDTNSEARTLRTDFQEINEQYISVSNGRCEKADGTKPPYDHLKKCNDLFDYLYPETFLGGTFSSKMFQTETFDLYTGGTTEKISYSHYFYKDPSINPDATASIRISRVGSLHTVSDRAKEHNWERMEYDKLKNKGIAVHYTNDYSDEYGRYFKGIWFQFLTYAVFAGYFKEDFYQEKSQTAFDNITITNDDAISIYNEVCFTPLD